MKRTMTVAVLAFLLVSAFALAGTLPTPDKDPGVRDEVKFGEADFQGDKVVVPIIIINDEPVTAIDIPLKFGKAGDAITLKQDLNIPDNSRLSGFDFKFIKVDNEAKTALIGLVSSMYDLKADMQPGKDAVAYLEFTVNKEGLGEFVIDLDNSRAPQHTLMLIQNRDVAGGGKEVVDFAPSFTKGEFKLGVTGPALPKEYSLRGNYPNPFNAKTIISFALPKDSRVTLDIYNILGQKVRTLVDGQMPAGYHNLEWDGADHNGLGVSSGVYLYKLKADEFQKVNRMTLVK